MSLINTQGWANQGQMNSGKDISRKLLAAAVLIAAVTILVKCVGLARDLVIASRLGRGDVLDAFIIANALPGYAVNVITGTFGAAVVPTFIEVLHSRGRDEAQRLMASTSLLSVILLVAATALLSLAGPLILPYMASGFSIGKLALTQHMFFVLLPSLILSGLVSIWGAVLNAQQRFVVAALAPALVPLPTIVMLLVMPHENAADALAWGFVLGIAFQAWILAWMLKKQGFQVTPWWHEPTEAFRQTIRQYIPMIAGVTLMSSTILVDQAMAAMLDPGSVAALEYANKLVAFALGLSTTALGTAALPHFSKQAAERDWSGLHGTLSLFVKLIFWASLPLIAMAGMFAHEIVGLIFQRGAFTAADSHFVGRVFLFLILQVPFNLAGILMVRAISALKLNRLLFYGAIINVSVNIGLNYILMQFMGVAGIALSTSFVYLASFLYLRATLNGELRRLII